MIALLPLHDIGRLASSADPSGCGICLPLISYICVVKRSAGSTALPTLLMLLNL